MKWVINRTNPEYIDYIAKAASISPLLAQVLVNRGIKTAAQINTFLNPVPGDLGDPYALPHLHAAIERISTAKKNGERVLVHGDYDADGVTATAIMVEGLKEYGLDVHYFIPDRIQHGYGFGPPGIAVAETLRAKLIITVDCGITSFEAVAAAHTYGIDVIITDHHEPPPVLPEATAIVNPKAAPCPPEMAHLSGAGIAFKVIQGLFGNSIDAVYKFLDLAALGTAADVVPVLHDNRIIIREGMKLIQSGERAGIRALKQAAASSKSQRTAFLYYALIPRINAAGRIANATDVVKLLTTRSESEAEDLAGWLNGLNAKRQEIEEAVHYEALQLLSSMDTGAGALVLASEGWHTGVVGIVASRIAEKYYRPAIVLSIDKGTAKGSGRSIPAFDLHDGLVQCRDVLTRFGGHKQAAGLALQSAHIERFRTMLCKTVGERLGPEDFVPVVRIDAPVKMSEVNIGLVDELARMEPFGYSNDEPAFGARELKVAQPRIVGNNHLKMQLRQNGRKLSSIGFDLGSMLDVVEESGMIDAVFVPTINEWDGGRFLQLNLKAIRPSRRDGETG